MTQPITHSLIDICICTYNRLGFLQQCLDKLIPQIINQPVVITVVDNNSNDGTAAYVKALEANNHSISYVLASEQGLSFARNVGWKESSCDWVFYLDDDCLPSENIVEVSLNLIETESDIEAFGGPIEAVFEASVPDWMPVGYGSFSMPYESTTIIDQGFIRGGCFLVRRSTLFSLNGFDTALGVTGKDLQYGEEIELQIRMRTKGLKIAYAPSLQTGHFVRKEKMYLRWVLRSEYARRRDKMFIEPVSLSTATGHLLRTAIGRLFWTPLRLGQSLIHKDYSFRKAVYQILKPLAYSLGEWVGVIKNKSHSQK